MEFASLSPGLIIAVVVSLALAPFVAVMVTSFTKMVVVLSLLRNALGLQQVPPNVVINGLALILSIYVMYPVILSTYDNATTRMAQLPQADMSLERAADIVGHSTDPIRQFLLDHSSEAEREFFLDSARMLLSNEQDKEVRPTDFIVLIPAFTVSELTAAFQIGFLIYLPFLIIDLIVSNLLMALGMIMMPPTLVSLPFKLLLFVLLDGWTKLVHGLVLTYT